MHSAAPTLKSLPAVYHSALRFTTGDGFRGRNSKLYERVGRQSLAVGGEQRRESDQPSLLFPDIYPKAVFGYTWLTFWLTYFYWPRRNSSPRAAFNHLRGPSQARRVTAKTPGDPPGPAVNYSWFHFIRHKRHINSQKEKSCSSFHSSEKKGRAN